MIILISTAALLPMGFLPGTAVFALLAFVTGLGWGPFNPLWNTVVQRRVDPASQGRIYGLQMSLVYAAPPLGQLLVGWGIENFGLRTTFSIVLALFALTSATIVSLRSLNDL
jgi:MFS family permease